MNRSWLILGLLAFAALAWWAVPFFFMGPSAETMESYRNSPQFNEASSRFENPVEEPVVEGRASTAALLVDFLFPPDNRRPQRRMPDHPPNPDALVHKSEAIRFAWLGHSTIMLELDGKRILIDPVFSESASPVPFTATRFQPPAWPLEELVDRVDAVVISHNHYDHLDKGSIRQLAEGETVFITPLGVGEQIIDWGIAEHRVIELDWWQETRLGSITLTASPAQHFSGRGINDRDKTLWASWSISGNSGKAFFSGDTGYGPHYEQIGRRLGPFDVTFLENGAYSNDWPFIHQTPEQAVQAHLDLRGRLMVPVHWGMFALGPHPWEEPAQRVTAEAKRRDIDLLSPEIGQSVNLMEPLPRNRWWEALSP